MKISSLLSRVVGSSAHHLFPNPIMRHQVYIIRNALKQLGKWFGTDKYMFNYYQRLLPFANKYKGQRCFLMGNGPSLNLTPLEKLKGEYVWGFNRCYLLFDRLDWRPAFYTAIDKRVVPDNALEINALILELPETTFFFPVQFGLDQIIKPSRNLYWFNEIPLDYGVLPDGMFSSYVPDAVVSSHTVTITALQLAVFLGFDPIYLIGCDTNYIVPTTSQYEDEANFKITSTDKDPNHFDPMYFGPGKKYHNPHPEKMIVAYHHARTVCDRVGVKVYNATIGGQLEIFPRVDFNLLFPV